MDARRALCQGGGGGGGGKALPTLQMLLRKNLTGNWCKNWGNGECVSEGAELRLGWAELAPREGERSKAGLWVQSSQQRVPGFVAQRGEESRDFCAPRVWLGFAAAGARPGPGCWRAFFNAASA